MDLARIQEWCNHWYLIPNPYKTKAIVISRSRTVENPYGDLVLSGVCISASPNLDILGVKFDSKLTFEDMCGIVPNVSHKILSCAWWNLDLWTPLCYFVILHLFSQSLSIVLGCGGGSAAERHLQLLERQVYSVAWLGPDHSFLCHRCCVARYSLLDKDNANSDHCLFSELSSATTRVRHTELSSSDLFP